MKWLQDGVWWLVLDLTVPNQADALDHSIYKGQAPGVAAQCILLIVHPFPWT